MDKITKSKIDSLKMLSGMSETGVIMTDPKSGRRAIVEMGAIRWLNQEEMWELMHPVDIRQPVEFYGHTFLLNPCPWCAKGEFRIHELGKVWTGMKYSQPTSYEVIHHCEPTDGQPSRPIIRVGRDLESAISAWNDRK